MLAIKWSAEGGWLFDGMAVIGGHNYQAFTQGTATLLVDTDISP